MPTPHYQDIMIPLLKYSADQKEHSSREAIDELANQFNLSEDERKELLPSGQQAVFDNRIGWATTYLTKALLLERTRRGYFKITDRGLTVLRQNPSIIDVNFLSQFDEFKQFRFIRREKNDYQRESQSEGDMTPEEALGSAYQHLRQTLANDILQQIKNSPPSLFEKIVVELLVKMGYGGSRQDAGKAIGQSGDEGIDGIIKEDRLGLDIIYIQAKRWENTVGRPEIQKFAGALQGQRAKKGIFITTSNYSKDAHEYASRIDNKIVLMDGEQLAQFMIDHNVGVTNVSNYEVKRIDVDYFTEA